MNFVEINFDYCLSTKWFFVTPYIRIGLLRGWDDARGHESIRHGPFRSYFSRFTATCGPYYCCGDANEQDGPDIKTTVRTNAWPAMNRIYGKLRKWRWLLSLLLFRNTRLWSCNTGRHLCSWMPAIRGGTHFRPYPITGKNWFRVITLEYHKRMIRRWSRLIDESITDRFNSIFFWKRIFFLSLKTRRLRRLRRKRNRHPRRGLMNLFANVFFNPRTAWFSYWCRPMSREFRAWRHFYLVLISQIDVCLSKRKPLHLFPISCDAIDVLNSQSLAYRVIKSDSLSVTKPLTAPLSGFHFLIDQHFSQYIRWILNLYKILIHLCLRLS